MAGGRALCIFASVCIVVGLVLSWKPADSTHAVLPTQPHWRPLPLEPLPGSARSHSLPASVESGSVGGLGVSAAGGAGAGAGGSPPPAALVREPLPNCSVVFFHHLEKTGGTTVRSILQRAAQLGQYDLFSFVNRFDKFQMQMIYHQLWHAMRTPGGLTNLRLAVEIHIGGNLDHPFFLKYTLPDLLHLRQRLRAAGCRCNLVTLLRHPLLQHLSWHYHFVNHRVPLCFWSNPPDCQSRLALGLTCHDGPRIPPLGASHASALSFMWRSFDVVGVTELFDEFVLALTDVLGLQAPAYRMQVVAQHTVSPQAAQRDWTNHSCAALLSGGGDGAALPGGALHHLLAKRMAGSEANAAGHHSRQGKSSTGGKPGVMECRGYGPCAISALPVPLRVQDAQYDAAACGAVSVKDVLERLCSRLAMDEAVYFQARRGFEERVRRGGEAQSAERLAALRRAGAALAKRAEVQKSRPHSELESLTGIVLRRDYVASSGGGVPWRADETSNGYMAHERARYSCHNCSGDVVPEKDLIGCWPLWPQFAPDELRFRCHRIWTDDPGLDRPKQLREGRTQIPFWRTCWVDFSSGRQHCSGAPCSQTGLPATRWREIWDAEMRRDFWTSDEGRELQRVSSFVKPNPTDFIWHVY